MTREEFWRQYWDRIDCAGTVAAELPEPQPFAGCWIWTGGRNDAGYGVVTIQKTQWLTHRLAYHVFNGELEPEMKILHTCNTKPCCNPSHLRGEIGVRADRENWDDVLEDYGLPKAVTD